MTLSSEVSTFECRTDDGHEIRIEREDGYYSADLEQAFPWTQVRLYVNDKPVSLTGEIVIHRDRGPRATLEVPSAQGVLVCSIDD